jgi:hypothetical protein
MRDALVIAGGLMTAQLNFDASGPLKATLKVRFPPIKASVGDKGS